MFKAETTSPYTPHIALPGRHATIFIPAQDGRTKSVTVTLAAPHHGIGHFGHLQGAEGLDLHATQQAESPPHSALQDHVGAGVGLQDARHRAGLAQFRSPAFRGPVAGDEAALLVLSTAVIVLVVEATFNACWIAHISHNTNYDGRRSPTEPFRLGRRPSAINNSIQ